MVFYLFIFLQTLLIGFVLTFLTFGILIVLGQIPAHRLPQKTKAALGHILSRVACFFESRWITFPENKQLFFLSNHPAIRDERASIFFRQFGIPGVDTYRFALRLLREAKVHPKERPQNLIKIENAKRVLHECLRHEDSKVGFLQNREAPGPTIYGTYHAIALIKELTGKGSSPERLGSSKFLEFFPNINVAEVGNFIRSTRRKKSFLFTDTTSQDLKGPIYATHDGYRILWNLELLDSESGLDPNPHQFFKDLTDKGLVEQRVNEKGEQEIGCRNSPNSEALLCATFYMILTLETLSMMPRNDFGKWFNSFGKDFNLREGILNFIKNSYKESSFGNYGGFGWNPTNKESYPTVHHTCYTLVMLKELLCDEDEFSEIIGIRKKEKIFNFLKTCNVWSGFGLRKARPTIIKGIPIGIPNLYSTFQATKIINLLGWDDKLEELGKQNISMIEECREKNDGIMGYPIVFRCSCPV